MIIDNHRHLISIVLHYCLMVVMVVLLFLVPGWRGISLYSIPLFSRDVHVLPPQLITSKNMQFYNFVCLRVVYIHVHSTHSMHPSSHQYPSVSSLFNHCLTELGNMIEICAKWSLCHVLQEAAGLGKKVAVCDFVKPSPAGTTWGECRKYLLYRAFTKGFCHV